MATVRRMSAAPSATAFSIDNKLNQRLTALVSHAILLFFVIVIGYPVLWMVFGSLKAPGDLAANLWGLPAVPAFDNYPTAWNQANLGRAITNSLIVTLSTVALVLAFAMPAGYALARFRLRFAVPIFLLFLLTMQAPTPIIPLYVMIVKMGLIDSYQGLILPGVAGGLPLSIFIFRSFFRSMPSELIEASVVDGCTRWGAFWRIAIPISGPAIATVAILQFLGSWNDFFTPLILIHSPELRTIPLAVQAFTRLGFGGVIWEQLFAALTIASLPMVAVYLLLQRWFVQGLTSGAIKG